MPDLPAASPETVLRIRAELHELAQLLRAAGHLEPDAQRTLADLLDELRDELDPAALHSDQAAHLAQTVAGLARALHEPQQTGPLVAMRDRLDDAVGRADAEAPVIVGVARRVLDALGNMGI